LAGSSPAATNLYVLLASINQLQFILIRFNLQHDEVGKSEARPFSSAWKERFQPSLPLTLLALRWPEASEHVFPAPTGSYRSISKLQPVAEFEAVIWSLWELALEKGLHLAKKQRKEMYVPLWLQSLGLNLHGKAKTVIKVQWLG
jgi:hypothetical protein